MRYLPATLALLAYMGVVCANDPTNLGGCINWWLVAMATAGGVYALANWIIYRKRG